MKKTLQDIALAVTFAALCFAVSASAEEEDNPKFTTPLMADDPAWQLDFSHAEMIAVQAAGRKKPLQTYAIETIEQIVGRPLMGSTFLRVPANKVDKSGEKFVRDEKGELKYIKLGAMDLYLSIWFFPEYWMDKPLILVSNNELRNLLTPPAGIRGADAGAYTGMGRELVFDEKRLSMRDLTRGRELDRSPVGFALKAILSVENEKETEHKKMMKKYEPTSLEADANLVFLRMQMVEEIANSERSLMLIPHLTSLQGDWISLRGLVDVLRSKNTADASRAKYDPQLSKTAIDAYVAFNEAYRARNAIEFKKTSEDFRKSLQVLSPDIYPTDRKLATEISYNNTRPFAWAWIVYVLAALTALTALKVRGRPIYSAALALYFIGLSLHVYGFALRCYIAGRPPVSNMYESVIWVGFGAVFFGMIFELIYRNRYYMLAGSFAGFLCLVLMDMVPVMMGNTKTPGFEADIKPLAPVLRDNFWLTVHVLTITLSYAAFMLAWGMGHISLVSHLLRPSQRVEHRDLHNFVYRVLQIGVLLLSIGTILGGVWAYYSWGRFWGWDPKETWAFIALMCYIVVLHGRFAGLWTNFGLAFGAVFCFLSIVMAWYGVNFVLGSGMHSYGSGGGGKEVVLSCVAVDMVFLTTATWQYIVYKKKDFVNPLIGVYAGVPVLGLGLILQRMADKSGGSGLIAKAPWLPITAIVIGAAVLIWAIVGLVIVLLHKRATAGMQEPAYSPDDDDEDQSARGRVDDDLGIVKNADKVAAKSATSLVEID